MKKNIETISGYPVVLIKSGSLCESDQKKFNSFECKIQGAPLFNGKFLGAITCRDSNAGFEDCIFTSGTARETQKDAMYDASQLFYELELVNDPK